jgi:hypothetical protein
LLATHVVRNLGLAFGLAVAKVSFQQLIRSAGYLELPRTHFDLDADRLGALPLDRFNLVDLLGSAALAAKGNADKQDKKDDHRNFPAREPGALYRS